MAVNQPQSKNNWTRILPGLIISAIALAVVFYLADPRRLIQALLQADYRLVAAGILISIGWLFLRSMLWRTLLQEKAGFSQVFFAVNEGYLLNNFLPFRLGEVGRALLLSYKAGLSFWFVFSTVLIERVLDLAMAFGLLLITLPFVVGADWARQAAVGAGGVMLLGLGVFYLLARNRQRVLDYYNKLSQRWVILEKFGQQRVEAFFSGLSVLTDGSRFLRAVLWAMANWLLVSIEYYVFLLAFAPETPYLWSNFALAIGALGFAVPSSPGAIGVYEAAILAALAIYGMNAALASAFALTVHVSQYLVTGILGAIGLARDGMSLTGVYRQARQATGTGLLPTDEEGLALKPTPTED